MHVFVFVVVIVGGDVFWVRSTLFCYLLSLVYRQTCRVDTYFVLCRRCRFIVCVCVYFSVDFFVMVEVIVQTITATVVSQSLSWLAFFFVLFCLTKP